MKASLVLSLIGLLSCSLAVAVEDGAGAGDGFFWRKKDVEEPARDARGNRIIPDDKVLISMEEASYSMLSGLKYKNLGSQSFAYLPVSKQWYAHGGGMGMAPALLASKKWVRILGEVNPDVYWQIRDKFEAEPESVTAAWAMTALVNNPVLVAFTHEHYFGIDSDHPMLRQPIELDAFFPPGSNARNVDADGMLVAHGVGSKHLRKEAKGKNTYEEVKALPQTEMGGVLFARWRMLFVHALSLSRPEIRNEIKHFNPLSWVTFNEVYKFGRPSDVPPFRIALDLKSGHPDPLFLRAFVYQLNKYGIEVDTIASFKAEQLSNLHGMIQRIEGQPARMVKAVLFFHGLYGYSLVDALTGKKEMIDRCNEENFFRDHGIRAVAFNVGAGLVAYPLLTTFGLPAKAKYREHRFDVSAEDVLAVMRCKRKHNLSVGIYAQEKDASPHAVGISFLIAQRLGSVFDLGLAWGGFPDKASASIKSTFLVTRTGAGSQGFLAAQRFESIKESALLHAEELKDQFPNIDGDDVKKTVTEFIDKSSKNLGIEEYSNSALRRLALEDMKAFPGEENRAQVAALTSVIHSVRSKAVDSTLGAAGLQRNLDSELAKNRLTKNLGPASASHELRLRVELEAEKDLARERDNTNIMDFANIYNRHGRTYNEQVADFKRQLEVMGEK